MAAGEQSELRSTGYPRGQDSGIWLVARSWVVSKVGYILLKSNLPHRHVALRSFSVSHRGIPGSLGDSPEP